MTHLRGKQEERRSGIKRRHWATKPDKKTCIKGRVKLDPAAGRKVRDERKQTESWQKEGIRKELFCKRDERHKIIE